MTTSGPATFGLEYIVDAFDGIPERLASPGALRKVVAALIQELHLHAVAEPLWHVFADPGGISGVILLAESHLIVHTFPERRYAAFNLYHRGGDLEWPWDLRLREFLGCQRVAVRTIPRGDESASIANAP